MEEKMTTIAVQVPAELYKRYSAHVRNVHGYVGKHTTRFFCQMMEAVIRKHLVPIPGGDGLCKLNINEKELYA